MSTKNNKKNLVFESDYFQFFDIALTLLKHLKLLFIFPSILCIWQIINVLFIIDPIFKSDARIMSSLSVQDGRQDISSIASQFGLNLGPGNNAPKWPYPEILKSRTMAEIMLKESLNLLNIPSKKLYLISLIQTFPYLSKISHKPFKKQLTTLLTWLTL